MLASDLSNSLALAVDRAARSLVRINGRRRASSGIAFSPDGAENTDLVVTAAHTLHRAEGVTVSLADGRDLPAALVGVDLSTDLAVLRLEEAHPAASASAAGGSRVGEVVLSIGRTPFGLRAAFGIVAGVAGVWRTGAGGRVDRYVNVDGSLPPGLSGGGLFTAEGELVGMNSSALTRGGGTLPVATLQRLVAQIVSHGGVRRAFLGLGVQPASLAGHPAAGGQEAGLLVRLQEQHGVHGRVAVGDAERGPADGEDERRGPVGRKG